MDANWLRDATNKVVRRVKKLIGRPDPSPWVLRPERQAAPGGYAGVDLVLAADSLDDDAPLARAFHRALSPYGLSLRIADARSVAGLTSEISGGKLKSRVLLDLRSPRAPGYAGLRNAAAAAGVRTVGGPAGDRNGDGVRKAPARMVRWEHFGHRPAYLRGYNILGGRTLLWWSPETHRYDLLTWDDCRKYDLLPAVELIDRTASLTGMEFFCGEIAVTNGLGQPRFVLADHGSDLCELTPASQDPHGPPDEWVRWVCERFAEFAWRQKQGIDALQGHPLWLAGKSDATASKRVAHGVNAA